MKHMFTRGLFLLLSLSFSALQAQIYEPEGLNLPGTWNGFTNPPAAGSAFGSSTQVPQGGVQLITTGLRRWQTTFRCSDADSVPSGPHDWLFTSGATGTAFQNKWAGVNVVMNTIQTYSYNTGADNSISLIDGMHYTINFRDNAYQNTQAIVMPTTNAPVHIDSLNTDIALNAVTTMVPVEVTAYLSANPSPEEQFYLRYSFDGFANSVVLPMTVFGSEVTASIPGFLAGNTIQFYVFSSTIQNIQSDYDLQTLQFHNNQGLNYQYTVTDPSSLVNLGPDLFVCAGTGPWTLSGPQGMSSYYWSNEETTQSITVNAPGEYWLQVENGNLIDQDTVVVNVAATPVVDLGNPQQTVCSGSITLQSGYQAPALANLITLFYDATQGQTGLIGSEKVYMHAGYEAVPFGGAVSWVGNWGLDDGIGQMAEVETDVWSITFNPYTYFNLPEGSPLNGMFVVFRNADGSATGKDDNGNDIYISLPQTPPYSAFSGLSFTAQTNGISGITWSTGASTSNLTVTASGSYWVSVTNEQGCSAADTVSLTFLTAPELTVSNDTSFCGTFSPFQISGSGNFSTWQWSNGAQTPATTISTAGTYVLNATAANGCVATDSVRVLTNFISYPLQLASSYTICDNQSVLLNPGVLLSPEGDSLTIIYDATQGQTGLVGAETVYMHSSFEYVPFGGAVDPWVGNWGQDDGIGQMAALGNNLWKITIQLNAYYNIPAGTSINGLFMVFRNADGSQTGKDTNGNDIFLNLSGANPTSSFTGVTASTITSPFVSALWSNGATTASQSVSTSGTYTVVFTDASGCGASDTTVVNVVPAPALNLGADRILCAGSTINLEAGPGFESYEWSTGQQGSSISVDSAGAYSLTVTNAAGCQTTDVVNVLLIQAPVASVTPVFENSLTVGFIDNSQGPANYFWDFNSDGTDDLLLNGDVFYTYPTSAIYNATLVLTNLCGADTLVIPVDLSSVGIAANTGSRIEAYPNPATDFIQLTGLPAEVQTLRLLNMMGQELWTIQAHSNSKIAIPRQQLPAGMYLVQVLTPQAVQSIPIVFRD